MVNVELRGLCLIMNVDEVGLCPTVYRINFQNKMSNNSQTQSSKSFTFATVIDWIIFSMSKCSVTVLYIPPHCQLLFFSPLLSFYAVILSCKCLNIMPGFDSDPSLSHACVISGPGFIFAYFVASICSL